jgi:hypothetical protein
MQVIAKMLIYNRYGNAIGLYLFAFGRPMKDNYSRNLK